MGKNNYALHVLFYNLAVRAATSKASAAIPKKLSQFENDSKFLTDEALKEFAKEYQKSLTAGEGISIEGETISSVTPFKYAEKNGYTGTEEEFAMAFVGACSNAIMFDTICNKLVLQADSVEKVNELFVEWWNINSQFCADKAFLLNRWFGNVLKDDRVHGVKLPLFATSTSAIGELTDDSVGLSCTPSTAAVAGKDDFAFLPQFWCLEVAMERNADGSHTINKVEHIDPISEVRSGKNGLCQVLQKNTYTKEWTAGGYHYLQMACDPADKTGWGTWPQGTGKNGKTYAYMANPKYYAGIGADGIITCGTGLDPVNYTSFNGLVSLWRKRGPQYSGASGNLLKWQLAMIRLKYARKGNSGTIEGCSSFYRRYKASVSETGVERIILTVSEGNNLLVGCNVHIGTSSDGYQIAKNVTVTAIESVTIDGSTYAAVYVDNGGNTFDTVSGTTYLSTMPWKSGRNDDVLGYDGSHTNFTNGWEPGLIQKTEFQNGAYLILSDELWQWSQDADGNYNFDCYTCHDQSKVTTDGSISADYTKQDDLTLVFPAGQAAGWQYIEDIAVSNDPDVIWPAKVSTKAGSGTGVKAGMYVAPASSGVRAPWCVCGLSDYGLAGLAARASSSGATASAWHGAGGSPSGISG